MMTTPKSLVAIAFLLFPLVWKSNAQENSEEKVNGQVPNITLSNVFYDKHGNNTIQLGELYNDSPLIINFWATWCGPCIHELRVLDSMSKEYPDLNVLSVTYESREVIEKFLDKNDDLRYENLTMAVQDTILHNYFPHQALPHNIWIKKGGEVIAVTGFEAVKAENIVSFMKGEDFEHFDRKVVHFDYMKPFQPADSSIYFRSIFHPYQEGIDIGGLRIDINGLGYPNMKHFYAFNVSRTDLIWAAFSRQSRPFPNWYLIELSVQDSTDYYWPKSDADPILHNSKYRSRQEWVRNNTFYYELTLPRPTEDSVFYDFVKRDILYNLNVNAYLEEKDRYCRIVKVQGNKLHDNITLNRSDSLSMKLVGTDLILKDVSVKYLLKWITQRTFGWRDHRSQKEPFIDETGLSKLSITLDVSDGNGKVGEIDNVHFWEKILNEQLGMIFSTEMRKYPVLIIKD